MAARDFVVEAVEKEKHHVQEGHGATYNHNKKVKEGAERKDRRSVSGTSPFPKKAGKGGRFTWEGPDDGYDKYEEDAALDEKDPNYVDPAAEEQDRNVAAGVVEVPKLAPEGIAVVQAPIVEEAAAAPKEK